MKTKIFAHENVVGAETDLENGKFINDIKGGGQLGCVVHTDECQITKEAKELIRNAPSEGGSFAAIMLTRHSDGSGSSIGLFGFGKHIFDGENLCISRDCDLSVLDDMEETEIEAPQEFIDILKEI